jgi:hypothetical protein
VAMPPRASGSTSRYLPPSTRPGVVSSTVAL